MNTPINHSLGFGLGLRKEHYADLLESPPAVDWLEVLTENYLVPGGKPLHLLDRICARYPLVMHGVSLSIGATTPLDWVYLRQVRELAGRIEPRWISDHLCWTGTGGINLHDLLPLPFNEQTLRWVSERVRRVQDYLGRQILLENVSSYVSYAHSTIPEWQFISALATDADCRILLDINNVYVSARNHNFDPITYLNAIPRDRVVQLHLAGHHDHGTHIIDTHDSAIVDPVWALYRAARRRFGAVPTMIERDDNIPPLADLVAELDLARRHAADTEVLGEVPATKAECTVSRTSGPSLASLQRDLQAHVLDPRRMIPACVVSEPPIDRARRVAIYSDGYRLRLIEALGTDYPVLKTLLGEDDFAELAHRYIGAHPSHTRSLRWFGARLGDFLRTTETHRATPLVTQLARFEWALGEAFDAADAPHATLDDLLALPASSWPSLRLAAHPSVRDVTLGEAVPAFWRELQAGGPVARDASPGLPRVWRVWRNDLRTLFRALDPLEIDSARILETGTFSDLCEILSTEMPTAEVPAYAANLLRTWVAEGAIAELASESPQSISTVARQIA
ncbi:MAG: MNIO family bufferin maturase [Gammaproteobacteria bacterium]